MGRLNFLADLFRRNKLVFVFLFISAVAIGGEFFDKINVDNLQLDGNTISSTDTNGNIELEPNGTGTIELKADTNVTGALSVTGTVDGRDVSADGAVLDTLNSSLGQITAHEADQLENIDTETISNQQWGFLGALDQSLTTVSDVVFATLGIGGNPDSSAIFDMTSTTKGSRPCPSMTEAQRDAISNPAIGLCVINTDTNKYNVYDGTAWTELGSGTGSYFEYAYKEAEITSETTTSVANTPTDVAGSTISDLEPGTWRLCYSGSFRLDENSVTNNNVAGNIRITDTSDIVVDGSISHANVSPLAGNQVVLLPISRCVNVNLMTTKSFKLRISCSGAASDEVCGFGGTNLAGSLSDPDSESIFYAERVK